MRGIKGIVVAGTRSGCGKTSVTLGLLAALRRRRLVVQPFKTGPDFIDPGHHELASGKKSHNLDGWMCGRTAVEDIFCRHAGGSDVAVIEGVMGLYDGFSGSSEEGSTAQIAKWLGLPVLLVVDASSMARSVAAMVKGFVEFDPDLAFAGIVFNNASSENHRDLIREAMETLPDVPVLGFLAKQENLSTPSRHLGLVTAGETSFDQDDAHALADWIETGVDIDRLLGSLPDIFPSLPDEIPTPPARTRIAVAWDAPFCFYYHENLHALEAAGAELIPFSPLEAKKLPSNIQGLYLGGGYPEVHAFDLSNNTSLRKDIRKFSEAGGFIYAECGGFMYLMESVTSAQGQNCRMTGIYPYKASLGKRFASLGYREITTRNDTILGPAGTIARGHEFHYSFIEDGPGEFTPAYDIQSRKGPLERGEGFLVNNTLGSYIHLHFASNPAIPRHIVESCENAVHSTP